MKPLISKMILVCSVLYIVLMLAESALHPEILFGAVVGSVLLAALSSVYFVKSEHAIHIGEVILLWIPVLLFVIYGALCAGGVL